MPAGRSVVTHSTASVHRLHKASSGTQEKLTEGTGLGSAVKLKPLNS